MKLIIPIIIIIAAIVIFILMCKRRKPLKFTGSDYSIPVLDLSQMPEKIKGCVAFSLFSLLQKLLTLSNFFHFLIF